MAIQLAPSGSRFTGKGIALQIGSDISGANVRTSSKRDSTVTANAVTIDKDVGFYAGRDLNVLATANTQTSQSDNSSGISVKQSTNLISVHGGNLSMQAVQKPVTGSSVPRRTA